MKKNIVGMDTARGSSGSFKNEICRDELKMCYVGI